MQSAEGRHLVESSLYKEDLFVLGHSAVWGSCWLSGPEADGVGRWGYACCQILNRDTPCTVSSTIPSREALAEKAAMPNNVEQSAELVSRETFDGPTSAFSRYVIEWLLHRWREGLAKKEAQIVNDELFSDMGEMQKASAALKPLLELLSRTENRLLKAKKRKLFGAPKVLTEREDWECSHCKYQNYGERVTCRKCKRDDENYVEPDEFPKFEELILEKVGHILELTCAREYVTATEVFLQFTIGTGRWNSEIMGLTGPGAPTRKARAAQEHMRRQTLAMAPLDTEEGKLYIRSLKRLVTLAQLLLPHADPSKNVLR